MDKHRGKEGRERSQEGGARGEEPRGAKSRGMGGRRMMRWWYMK